VKELKEAFEKKLEDLEKRYANLSKSNYKLWVSVKELAKTVERMAGSEEEFVKKVNQYQGETTKALNEIRDNVLFLSTKGSKPS
jgi:hypothetical protein